MKRLEGSGYLETYSVEHNSRLRKYYRITEEGKAPVFEFLEGRNQIEKMFEYVRKEIEHE